MNIEPSGRRIADQIADLRLAGGIETVAAIRDRQAGPDGYRPATDFGNRF